MRYFSTRGAGPVTLDESLVRGIASDGGLYMPQTLPEFTVEDFATTRSIPQVAARLMAPFFSGSTLQDELDAILDETFSFPIPITALPAGQGWTL
jgi:threonine synthase